MAPYRTLLLAALLAGATAHAQVRAIPEEAKRGEMRHVQNMIVNISGTEQRLAPGAQIRDAANRVVLPASVPPNSEVKYTLDAQGQVRQVWILTPHEAAKQ